MTRLVAASGFGLCQTLILRHRIVFHDLAFENPDLDPAGAIGRLRGGDAIVDVRTQRVQRNTSLVIPFDARNFGAYGLKAMEPERLTAREIEAARRAITRQMKRAGRVWIRIFPDVPVSKKPIEVRMGKGKGTPELWVCRIKPGRVLFEIDGVSVQVAREALDLAAAKLPIKTRFVARIAA